MNEFPKFMNRVFRTSWIEGKNNDLQRFQILQNFQVQNKFLRVIHLFPRNFQKNEVLRLQQLMQASLHHYQAPSERSKPRRFKCPTPSFKYHLSINSLNTFQASWTHPNRGCLSHCFRHDPQRPRVGPSLNPDIGVVLFLTFSNHRWHSLYPMQFKISIRRRRNLSPWEPK